MRRLRDIDWRNESSGVSPSASLLAAIAAAMLVVGVVRF